MARMYAGQMRKILWRIASGYLAMFLLFYLMKTKERKNPPRKKKISTADSPV
jgi:hypothetical protein